MKELELVGFVIEAVGFVSEVDRGWGNGYVAVPKGNPLYGVDYSELYYDVTVHGDLTFSSEVSPGFISNISEYVAGDPTDKDLTKYWVFGFDTGHFRDNKYNCNEAYVISETIDLYNQLLSLSQKRMK